MRMKLRAFVVSVVGTVLPCFVAGAIVGIFFRSSFWYWTLGIAVLALFYVCLDRIPVRLFAGSMQGLSFWSLLKYGFASTEKRPVISAEMVNEENEWRTMTYNHFYGDDR
ncbi:MAG: hypothetical protein PHC49_09830 [Desulfuromonadaceae bacterium]|nr:hypothetical protein [Desulfuromonadaceae bacterium]